MKLRNQRLKFLPQDKREHVEVTEPRSQNYMPAGREVKHMNLGGRNSEDRGMADLRNTYSV